MPYLESHRRLTHQTNQTNQTNQTRSTAMHDTFTDIELIARHRISERVRYSPRNPKRHA